LCRVCFANYASIEVTYVPMDSWLELPERFPDSAFFFVSPDRDTHNILTELWHRKPCFVVTGASWELPVPFPTVDSENRGSVRRAVEYLLHLGHRRIALVNGEDECANCRDRQHGYEDALTAWDVNIEPEWEIAAGGSMTLSATARNQLADLLLARTAPTAVFCAGYYLALEVMGVASRFGISLPDQLSLVAVDDPISASYLKPSLTTLRQPLAQIGARGAERLLALMQNGMPDTPLAEFLPCELILRDSCVAPRAAAPGQILELPGQRR
jgi:DNA-binding LacI/PurR family transcriptional regulator